MSPTTPSPSKFPSSLRQWDPILDLSAHLLDPKSLATASCVSKSWRSITTSDHLWLPLCLSHYPSLATSSSTTISPRRLFALLRSSSARRRRPHPVPRISLADLIFAVDVFNNNDNVPMFSIVKSGKEAIRVCNHVFRFDFEVEETKKVMVSGGAEMRVVWNVVMKGWEGAFLMMDRVGKGRVIGGGDQLWFEEELPGPACCSRAVGGRGVVAELGFGLGLVLERVSLGLMSASECRYLGVNDALLYLQPFLLP